MENHNQKYEEQVSIVQWYIDHFKNRVNSEMVQLDFEPNATQEYDGYDGVNTELSKNLAKMGIDSIKIFTSPEQSKRLFEQCSHIKNIQSFHKDQLASMLISSTRKPYHDISTWKLYDDVNKNLEVEDILDSRLLAEVLLREKERLERIEMIEDFLWRWRDAHIQALTDKTLASTHESFYDEIEQLWLAYAYTFEQFEYIIDHILYGWKKIYRKLRKGDKTVSQEDQKLFQSIKKDSIYHFLVGSTWAGEENIQHVFDDEKLAKILFELSQK